MTSIKQSFTELVSLTKLFLVSESSLEKNEELYVTPELSAYFQATTPPIKQVKSVPAQMLIPAPTIQQPVVPVAAKLAPPIPTKMPEPPPPIRTPAAAVQTEARSAPLQSNTIKEKPDHVKGIHLEPLPTKAYDSGYAQFAQICKEIFPDLPLSEKIPNDAIAKKRKDVKHPVLILSFSENEQENNLLTNMAKAITLHITPAKVLHIRTLKKDNLLETVFDPAHVRLVITTDYDLYLQADLMRHYEDRAQHGKHFLHRIPLLLLSNLSLYLKEPQLKSLLWRAICNELSPQSSVRV